MKITFVPTHAKKIKEFLPVSKGKKVLDIGCHVGRWAKFFPEADYYGVDISDSVKIAKKNGLKVRQHDITKGFPYKSNYFDILFARDVIEHIADVNFFLSECHRILKKGGYFVFTTPNVASINTRLRLLFFGQTPTYISSLENLGHVHIFSSGDLRFLLKKNKFKVDVIAGSYLYILPWLGEDDKSVFYKFVSGVATRFPTIAAGLIVRARK
ncbi:MAG: class I SAM-dependent methyltransferase [Candidatus Aenigmatarchaeota archaeon]